MTPIETHDNDAPNYDKQAKEWGWNPEVIFGLMYQFIKPGQKLLDIGIGTGLCSVPFHKAGLKVSGFDGSAEMLEICRYKRICTDLKQHEMETIPWPYGNGSFDHAICGGVLHFFGELELFFNEVAHLLKPKGLWGFTVSHNPDDGIAFDYTEVIDQASKLKIFSHHHKYILRLFKEHNFTLQKQLIFLASFNPETQAEHFSRLYIAQKLK